MKNCEIPNFAACEFVNFRRWPDKVNTINSNHIKEQDIIKDNLLSVLMVSTYHYILQAPGRIYHTMGKSDPYDIFSGGCVFIHHDSGYMIIKHQVNMNSTETAKAEFTIDK